MEKFTIYVLVVIRMYLYVLVYFILVDIWVSHLFKFFEKYTFQVNQDFKEHHTTHHMRNKPYTQYTNKGYDGIILYTDWEVPVSQ